MKHKRKGGLLSKLVDAILGEKIPTLGQARSNSGAKNITDLPAQYDDVPLSGDRYIDGRCCRTVGELKEAERNDPTMGGWSG